jgi:glucokinase
VVDGEIEFTNLNWDGVRGDLLAHFEFEAVELINDFAAQALACPLLEGPDLRRLGPDLRRGSHECPIVTLGAGTGFGVAALARSDRGDIAISTEGGHAAFAPTDETEYAIWRRLHVRHGRVSIERLLSGPGPLRDLLRARRDAERRPGAARRDGGDQGGAGGRSPGRHGAAPVRRHPGLGGRRPGAHLRRARRGLCLRRHRAAHGRAPGLRHVPHSLRGQGPPVRLRPRHPTFLVLHPYPAIVGAARQLEQMERL